MKGSKMSKNINFKKQDEWVAAKVSQPFTFEYEGETIEVNPVFSPEQCMRIGDEITAIVVGADRYYPELRTFAQRLSVVNAIVTNIKIDGDHIFRHWNWLMYTDFYNKLWQACSEDVRDYIRSLFDAAEEQIKHVLDIQHKNAVDLLMETLLDKANQWMDKQISGVNVESVLQAVQDLKELNQEDKLVPKILEFRDRNGGDNETVRGEVSGIPQEES